MKLTYYKYSVKRGVQKIKTRTAIMLSIIGLALSGGTGLTLLAFGSANAATSYSNGFEVDTSGWFPNGDGTITRTATGADGITSATGAYHADVTAPTAFGGAFTRWGGYENTFPANGYSTQVDVYLDMAQNPSSGTDKRFDFSSAIGDPSGGFRRDFIFNVGTDPTTTGQFVMSASNNAPGWPSNPGRDPFTISQTGWYTLRHTFSNVGGVLSVQLSVLNSGGTVLHSWTLSDPSDVIGTTVGGHRYGWFVDSDFSNLAIDNSRLVSFVAVPSTKDECKNGGWMSRGPSADSAAFANQGQCVSWVNHNDGVGQDDQHAHNR